MTVESKVTWHVFAQVTACFYSGVLQFYYRVAESTVEALEQFSRSSISTFA